MRNLFFLAFAAACALPARAASTARELQNEFNAVIARSRPAVVNIRITQERRYISPYDFYGYMFGLQSGPQVYRQLIQGNGSGVMIDPDGYIITNEHVVEQADEITVTLTGPDGKETSYQGRVAGKDPYLDLAVVKIKAEGPLPYLKLNSSGKNQAGDWAIAIGSPFGLAQTATVGVISAVRQTFVIDGRKYHDMIQTDAAVNMGNSGGALINIDGELIGINTAIYSPSGASAGIGFAIPSQEALRVLDSLKNGGGRRGGWLGIAMRPLDEAMQGGWKLRGVSGGAVVAEVDADSPAGKAGFARGDIIISCDGGEIASPSDLSELVSRREAGSALSCDALRRGRKVRLDAVLSEKPGPAPQKRGSGPGRGGWEGVIVRDGGGGAEVAGFEKGSRLADYLQPGDVVKAVNNTPCADAASFAEAAKTADMGEGVVFDIVRRGMPMYISVKAR
ncbi:MAG: trypsin-like peptidase domain-containing protein [Elusimicrobiales bacterium]